MLRIRPENQLIVVNNGKNNVDKLMPNSSKRNHFGSSMHIEQNLHISNTGSADRADCDQNKRISQKRLLAWNSYCFLLYLPDSFAERLKSD